MLAPVLRFQFVRTLGRGSYGEVALCEDLKEGGKVAIKRVLNVFNSEVRLYRVCVHGRTRVWPTRDASLPALVMFIVRGRLP